LKSDEVSRFHMLRSDEIWYYHTGSSLTICTIDEYGKLIETTLGKDLEKNEVFQAVIPAGTIFGAFVNEPDNFTIVGCMVSPGFTFEDFELLDRQWLLKKYPQHSDIILKMTNP
jgi:predicted cupin superfamily sugar epimerase